MANRLSIGVSSHIINLSILNSSVVPLCLLKLHKFESSTLISILNLKCEVRPPGRMEEVMPNVIVTIKIICFDSILANNAQYKKVFPVPFGPSIKKKLLKP